MLVKINSVEASKMINYKVSLINHINRQIMWALLRNL